MQSMDGPEVGTALKPPSNASPSGRNPANVCHLDLNDITSREEDVRRHIQLSLPHKQVKAMNTSGFRKPVVAMSKHSVGQNANLSV